MIWKKINKKQTAQDLLDEVENIHKTQQQRTKNITKDNPHVNEMGDLLEWEN